MGLKETQSIVNAIATRNLYETPNKDFQVLMEQLWLHSLSSAYASRSIARRAGLGDVEKHFFMGLIHDIGSVLLLKALGDIYPKLSSIDMNEITSSIHEVHAGFGAAIIRRWAFGEEFVKAALLHEGPKFNEKIAKSVLAVNLASNIAHNIGYQFVEEEEIELSELDSVELLGLEPEVIENIFDETKKQMEEMDSFF